MGRSRFAGRAAVILVAGSLLAACGGGGGGNGGGFTPPPADTTPPTVPGALQVTGTTASSVSLSWTASTDTGGSLLAGYRVFRDGTSIATVAATSYTDSNLAASTAYSYTVAAYDGAGNQSAAAGPLSATTSAPPAGNITLSGRVTFDRPRYRTTNPVNTLNFSDLQRLPVRGATLEVLRASDSAVLTTTTTDANGDYTAVFASTPFIVRAKAQLLRTGAGGYDFEVRNNTSNNALYALDSAAVSPGSNTVTVNLNAATGWGGSSYTGTRSAAPFSILDMLYRAKELLLQAEPGLTLPALDVHWSPLNRAEDPPAPCNTLGNPVTGQIGTTFYLNVSAPASGNCPAVPAGIYVLGDASGDAGDDADEFDVSVIAHEFGHYYEDKFSRTDSMGGPHSLNSKLDLTIAFSEAFGNAFQGFVLSDPVYRDTIGASGNQSFYFDIEANHAPFTPVEGFFSEASVAEFLWDVFDGVGEGGTDAINLGFAPIHTVMRNEMRTTEALTSIYVMRAALEFRNGAQAAAITSRLAAEGITGVTDFAFAEGPVAGDAFFDGVYVPLVLGTPLAVTSINAFADAGDTQFQSYNRHGGRRYLRIFLGATLTLRITAQGGAGRDPDFVLYRNGVNQCPTFSGACYGADNSVSNGLEEAVYANLPAGSYVLDVADCSNLGTICRDTPAPGNSAITVTAISQ